MLSEEYYLAGSRCRSQKDWPPSGEDYRSVAHNLTEVANDVSACCIAEKFATGSTHDPTCGNGGSNWPITTGRGIIHVDAAIKFGHIHIQSSLNQPGINFSGCLLRLIMSEV